MKAWTHGNASFALITAGAKGSPPKVSAKGSGSDTAVRVGASTMRFDGRKTVFQE